MAKIKVQCPKCGRVQEMEIHPYGFDRKGISLRNYRCIACGAWTKMNKK